jgi:DNA invertase Pin-like site-specific DNA recombinase
MWLDDTRGTKSPNAKLTESQAMDIHNRRGESAVKLANEYGIHRSIIYRIWNKKAYRMETGHGKHLGTSVLGQE